MVSGESNDCLNKILYVVTLVCCEAVPQNMMEWDGWTEISLSLPLISEEGLDCHEYFKDNLRRETIYMKLLWLTRLPLPPYKFLNHVQKIA